MIGRAGGFVAKYMGDGSRESIMRQAANLRDLELALLLPGIRIRLCQSGASISLAGLWRG